MIGKLTIQEVAKILVEKNNLTQRDANKFATEMFAVIQHGLGKDGQAKVKGLGTFKIIDVEARESISVRTGERVVIDGHSKVTFTPDAMMRELVNRPFSQFETVVLNDGVEFEDIPEETEEEEVETDVEPTAEPAAEAPDAETIAAIDTIETPETPEAAETSGMTAQPAEPVSPVVQPLEEFVVDTPKHSWKQWLLAAAGVLVLMGMSAIAGYHYGRSTVIADSEKTISGLPAVAMAKVDSAANDTATVTQPVAKEEPKPQQEVEDIWSQKDNRVRLGYYRIVGTDKTVTVQAGQTFRGICKSHLGPGMECYVEVYNNLPKNPTVKDGQELKIPKLEVRKKKNLRKKKQE